MPCDYKKYTKNWKEISQRIKQRAKNKCEICDAENYKPHPVTGSKVILTVHHLDFNIQNNEDYNLIALCQRCHNRLDARYRAYKRRKKKE